MPCIPSHVGLIGKAWKTLLAFVLVVSLIPSSALANSELANVGDAATAAPQVQARSYTWYGADAATTVEMGRVTVEGADLSALPDPDSTGACAEATRLEAGDPAYDKVAAAVAKRWSGDPALLRVYSFRVLDGSGSEVAVPEGAEVTFEYTEMLNGGVAPRAFSLADDGTLRELETTQGANYVEGMMFDVAAHGADPACVAFVDTTGLEERPSAPQVQARSYTWYGADAATTVEMGRVTVEGADLSALPDPDSTGACAEATRLEAGDPAYDKVAAAVAKRWSGDPALLRVYSFRVLDGSGSEVAVPEGAEVTFEYTEMLNGGVAPRAFSLADDGTLRELETTQGANYVEGMMFDVAAHGADPACVAFVDTTGLEEKKQLEAGVYTVDANLYVPGYQAPIGSNAYMTTNDFPPVNKGRQNGELSVGENGELTVTVYPVHEIFTLQDIHDGDDAHIESIERGGFASSYGSHPDRITKLVVKLDNDNGTYKFKDCVQYPTILEEDKNWDIFLSVDFDSAVKGGYDPSKGESVTKTFEDESTGVNVTVSTTEKKLSDQFGKVSLVASEQKDGNSYDEAVELLKSRYVQTPPLTLFDMALIDQDGNAVDLSGNTKVTVSLPNPFADVESKNVVVWGVQDGELSSQNIVSQNGRLVFSDGLGLSSSYAVVDTTAVQSISIGKISDSTGSTDVTGTLSVVNSGVGDAEFTMSDLVTYSFGQQVLPKGTAFTMSMMYDNYAVAVDAPAKVTELKNKYVSEGMDEASAQAKAEEEIHAQYRHTPGYWYNPGEASMSLSFPAADGSQAILVRDDGVSVTAEILDSAYENGRLKVDLIGDYPRNYGRDLLRDMDNAYRNGLDSATEDAPIAYILIMSNDGKIAGQPYLSTDWGEYETAHLTYNGEEQLGVRLGAHNKVVSGSPSAVDAGEYKVAIAPENGYTWFDGTNEPIEFTYDIERAPITFRLSLMGGNGSSVMGVPYDFDAASLSYALKAFTSDGEEVTDYSGNWPVVTESSKIKEAIPGTDYRIYADYSNVSSESGNYKVSEAGSSSWRIGTVRVGISPDDEPNYDSLQFTYDGKGHAPQLSSNGKYSFQTYNVKQQKDVGEYEFVVGFNGVWSDGSTQAKRVSWSVSPATLTAVYEGDVVKESASEAKGAVSVVGFVNGESAEQIEGYQAPSVKIPENLAPGKEYELTPEGGYAGKNYVFEYVAGKLVVDASFAPAAVYTLTANLSMPGEYNPVLSGVDVYVNNPNNPFTDKAGKSPVLDGASGEGVAAEAPTKPLDGNAKVTVAADGSKTLVLDLPNPVFTLQELGTCADLPEGSVSVETKQPADKSVWDYGKYVTRICRVSVKLPADAKGTVTYTFTGSKLYAVPLNADIQPEAGKPALKLVVDLDSAKESGSAAVDRSALEAGIALAKAALAGVVVSADGSDVSTEGTWVSQEAADAFRGAIDAASSMYAEKLVSQQMIDDALAALNEASAAFANQAKPGLKDERVKVEKPAAASGLVYNGLAQTGVQASEGFVLSGAEGKDAGDYVATATLKDGFTWADGTVDPVEVTWSIAKAKLVATYAGETVSPGAKPGLGVEVTGFVGGETALSAAGYQAPSVSAPASLEAGKSYELVPSGGAAANYEFVYVGGTLKVEKASSGTLKAGAYAITANLSMPGDYNPVIPGATVYVNNPNNPFADKAGHEPVLDGNNPVGVVSTTPTTPLTKNATLVVAADGTKTLELDVLNPVFTTQELGTCAELPKVDVTRKAPADASVWSYGKYDTRISHVSVPLTDDMVTGVKPYTFAGSKLYAVPLDMDIAPTGTVALQLTVNYSSLPASALPDGVDPVPDPDPEPTPDPVPTPDPTPTPSPSPSPTPGGSTTVGTTTSGHFAAGTYTVSANLWFDKATTGLPLNPHLTNGGFPPSTPVSNNATMTVDASGHAWVSAPVVIQDKVMTVNNVWGSGVSFDGSTVTIDLGTPSASRTSFAGTCTSSVTIGWLARTIAAGIFNGVWDHTWSTNWEVDLGSTLPASGGGQLPAEAQAILNGENGVSGESDAAAAALAAAEDGSAKADGAAAGKTADGKASGSAKGGVAGAIEDVAEAAASNPAVAVAIGCAVVAVVAAAVAGGVYAYRRKKRAAAGEVGDAAK